MVRDCNSVKKIVSRLVFLVDVVENWRQRSERWKGAFLEDDNSNVVIERRGCELRHLIGVVIVVVQLLPMLVKNPITHTQTPP